MRKYFSNFLSILTFMLLNPIELKMFRLRRYEKYFKFQVFSLNIVYCFFSLIFVIYNFEVNGKITLNVGITLQAIQTIVPSLLSFYFAIDLMKFKKINLRLKIGKALLHGRSEEIRMCKVKLFIRLLVLLLVRAIKLSIGPTFTNYSYALCTMLPELITSMSDFLFAFYVEVLAIKIAKFNTNLRALEMDLDVMKEVEAKMKFLHDIARGICKVYSSRLILTIWFNFIQLVISLFWIFIRIAFNHLKGVAGFVTFLYIVQPLLCIYAICHAAQQCLNAVFIQT